MIVPDVNLLIYAVVPGYEEHPRARDWWEGALNDAEPVGLTPVAVFGFTRIVTSRRIMELPLLVDVAAGLVGDWLALPHVGLLSPGPDHVRTAMGFLRQVGTGGNLTTDAQIAAHAIESRGVVHSNDTDFARFPGVSWRNPLSEA